MKRLEKAIAFALERHAGQLRKGSNVPYITHPLEVMNLLMQMEADPDLLIAGLLHDTVEDTHTSPEELEALFGQDAAQLVVRHSEDKTKSWQQRKEATIAELKTADRRLKLLVLADKLSNLRNLAKDYAVVGEELWQRFNAPAEKQSWYYAAIRDALQDLQDDPHARAAYRELAACYQDAFVRFFLSSDRRQLYRRSRHGETHVLTESAPHWVRVEEAGGEDRMAVPLSPKEAEAMEDRWRSRFLDR